MADVVILGPGPIVVDRSVYRVPGLAGAGQAEVGQVGLALPFADVIFVRLFEGALLEPQDLLGPFVPPGPANNTVRQVPALLLPPETDVRFERVAAPLRATIGFSPIIDDSGNIVGQRPIFIDGPLPDGFAGIQIYTFPTDESNFPQTSIAPSRAVPNALGGPGNAEGNSPGLFLSPDLAPIAPFVTDAVSFSNASVAGARPIPLAPSPPAPANSISSTVPNAGVSLHVRFLGNTTTLALRNVVRTIGALAFPGGDDIEVSFMDGNLPIDPAPTDRFVIETAPIVDLTPGQEVIL